MHRAFLYNLYENDVKFPLATLFGGRCKHRDKFNFFSESVLRCVPQDIVGKITYICYLKGGEINAKKLKNKNKTARIRFDS